MKNDNIESNDVLEWDRYKAKSPEVALERIYCDAQKVSEKKLGWYQKSIKNKRLASLWSRGAVFVFLLLGTALPLLAGLGEVADERLLYTQVGITLLVVAGLVQIADKAFGWSSGWMRYISTAASMEGVVTTFELTWSKHLLSKVGEVTGEDVAILFAAAEQSVRELNQLQTEETNGWITEFNAGISLLDAAIKAQRKENKKELDAIRVAHTTAQKAKEAGVIDLALTFESVPQRIAIYLDGSVVSEDFNGTTWSSGKLIPGLYKLSVKQLDGKQFESQFSVSVEPGKIVKVDMELPF